MQQPRTKSSIDDERMPIRHVGVCVDRSVIGERIGAYAVTIAGIFDATLTILHALEPPRDGSLAAPIDPLDWELARHEAHTRLSAMQAQLAADAGTIRTALLEGSPAEEIRDWVGEQAVDLTVLASHGEHGWSEWCLASTARKLLDVIPGSVLLVPAGTVQEPAPGKVLFRHVLVLLDGSVRAESVLPLAAKIAQAQDGDLILLHVVEQPEPPCCNRGGGSDVELDLDRLLIERNKRAADIYLSKVRDRIAEQGIRVRAIATISRDLRGEILRCIRREQAELVVFSGHGRGAGAGHPFGSVAGFVLEHASAPLLVIRERSARGATPERRSRSRTGIRLPHAADS